MKQLLEYAALLLCVYLASTGLGWLAADICHQVAVVIQNILASA
ncbi:MAG: hypothetical protein ACXV99_12710 [Candidatus Angelobacter sp.]